MWPIVAVVATIALFAGYVAYTRTLVGDIRQDTERLATLYARSLRIASPEEAQLLLFDTVIQDFPYPVILTDESGEVIQWIHVAEAGTITLLRYLPYIQAALLAALALIAFWLIRWNVRVQRGQIWVAMARESAHQLGTPISSLYGWVELLRAGHPVAAGVPAAGGEDAGVDPPSALAAMEQDLDRLTKVANRFELIGRKPRLEPLDPRELVRELEEYCRARLPRRGHRIDLVTRVEPTPHVAANRTLLEWALENLVKNAVDALQGRGGTISVRLAPDPVRDAVVIEVADDGPGIPRAIRKRVFEPGVSTKSRGWGVGLSLARRIVEDYHDGALELLPADPGAGAAFRVTLPAAGGDSGPL